jgi:hypothetical protein
MEVHRPKFLKGLIEEVFVIVLSISLAVIAENIVEHYHHKKESKEALVKLKTELKKDMTDLNFNYPMHKKAINAEQVLTDWSKGKIQLSDDSLAIYASHSLNWSTFYSNTSEFESLKSSSKISFIEDKELVSKIFENYNRYAEYKLYSNNLFTIGQNLSSIYKKNTSFVSNTIFKDPFLLFDAKELMKLKGNKEFENTLQEKKEWDQLMILTIDEHRTRVNELIKLIEEEKK